MALDVDYGVSSISVSGPPPDSRVLAGSLTLELGVLPPLSSPTTFDLRDLTLVAIGPEILAIRLDPGVANPGAGVLNVIGQFLIPSLFLQIEDGLTTSNFVLSNVMGTLTTSDPGCPAGICLDTYFEIEGGAPYGTIAVRLAAIPEPSIAVLIGLGVVGLGFRGRRPAVAG